MMDVTRRTILLGGSGALASLAADRSTLIAGASGRPAAVVYDMRFPVSRRMAEQMRDRGFQVFDTSRDAAALWYGQLRPLMAQTNNVLAGMTSGSDRLVLQELARDERLTLLHTELVKGRGGQVFWILGSPTQAADTPAAWPQWKGGYS